MFNLPTCPIKVITKISKNELVTDLSPPAGDGSIKWGNEGWYRKQRSCERGCPFIFAPLLIPFFSQREVKGGRHQDVLNPIAEGFWDFCHSISHQHRGENSRPALPPGDERICLWTSSI
jgi:hypothetical protein